MADVSLAKKMKIKSGQRLAIVNAPEGYLRELRPLPPRAEVAQNLRGTFDWVQAFVKSKGELEELAPKAARALRPGSLLWLTFPKGTSRIQTDLTRDNGWAAIRPLDLKFVNLISVNETWSAFCFRPYRSGEPRQSFSLA